MPATHLPNLLLRLSERQRLRLSKEVTQQDPVMFRVRDRVVRCCGRDEVSGDELRALVHELVEGMLTVCAGCAPDDWLRRYLSE